MTSARIAVCLLALTIPGPLITLAGLQRGGEQPQRAPLAALTATPTPAPVSIYRPVRASRSVVRSTPSSSSTRPATVQVTVEAKAPTMRPSRQVPAERQSSSPSSVTSSRRAMWLRLGDCEAPDRLWRYGAPGVGGDPGYEQFEGFANFLNSTWLAHGGGRFARHAYDATPDQQIEVAEETLRVEGVGAWPRCGPRVGLVKR